MIHAKKVDDQMEDNLNGDNQNGRRSKWKTTIMDDDQNGR